MRKFALIFSAALMMGSMAFPAGALESGIARARAQNATLTAENLKCGGQNLRCGSGYAKVCNPKTNKCCCAVAGQYR
jgi:hypothetical protein